MEDRVVKEALSYALGSDLHEAWRASRRKEDGTFEPRIKKSKDEAWNAAHGTDEVDIANCTFSELPSNWQYENLEAAKVAIDLVYDKSMNDNQITPEELEEMGSVIHNEWLGRNDWVFDKEYGNPALAVPYNELSEEEKIKDKQQVMPALVKVEDFKNGLIDVDKICNDYNIPTGKTL